MSTPNLSNLTWRKSSYTNPNNCVEIAWPVTATAIRDSKNPDGPMLVLARLGFAGFLERVTQ